MKIGKDPSSMKAPNFALEYLYPEPNNAPVRKYKVSNVTNPETYISNPNQSRNKEVQEENLEMRDFFYNNVDPRRKQELADSRMIQEDHNSIANLPRQAIHSTFDPDVFPERLAMYNQSRPTKR